MSAMGHEQTSRHVRVMSVIPIKADIHQRGSHVRYVPKRTPEVGFKPQPGCDAFEALATALDGPERSSLELATA